MYRNSNEASPDLNEARNQSRMKGEPAETVSVRFKTKVLLGMAKRKLIVAEVQSVLTVGAKPADEFSRLSMITTFATSAPVPRAPVEVIGGPVRRSSVPFRV